MTWLPFICLGIGIIIGFSKFINHIMKPLNVITNGSLIVLMWTIGAKVGTNDALVSSIGWVSFRCMVIAFFSIFFSVLFIFILEKTFLPLEEIRNKLTFQNIQENEQAAMDEGKKSTSPLVWIIPGSILFGVFTGYLLIPDRLIFLISYCLTGSLIILYTSIGISLSTNLKVFQYVKLLGWKIVLISIAIFIGSLTGGMISGMILKIPSHIATISACGMSYYSVTSAYMTQVYGIEAGVYGFIVNVLREFLTVLLLPFMIKISKGSPIAGGAAGSMDTMLAPVTKFVGSELGLVALITGTILTLAVPFILPILANIFVI